MINFNVLDFSECRSEHAEKVIWFFWRSMYNKESVVDLFQYTF